MVASAFTNYAMEGPPPPVEAVSAVPKTPPKRKEKRLVCEGCTPNETVTVSFLQDRGIKDRNAMATVLGNIRQESMFHPNICEGGARVPYHECRVGGFGLIQFTSPSRYYGLGKFADRYGGDPSGLKTQLRYIVNETQWKRIEDDLMIPGRSIEFYMGKAYSWIGWGHHGRRTHYAYDYARRLKHVEV